jgi:hypothetical protein
LEWVAVLQDELSACLMVTGEEVLETLGPLVSCVGCRYQIIVVLKFFSNVRLTKQKLILLKFLNILRTKCRVYLCFGNGVFKR